MAVSDFLRLDIEVSQLLPLCIRVADIIGVVGKDINIDETSVIENVGDDCRAMSTIRHYIMHDSSGS